MAKHTKIIELYGLPGCGKTTLCIKLKKVYELNGYKVGLINEASKTCTFTHVLSVLLLKDIIALFRWFYNILRGGNMINKISLSPYKRLLIYRCIKGYSDCDYVFIEHGIIQCIVSSIYGIKDDDSLLNKSICKLFLHKDFVDMFLYCHVTPEEAFKRIRIRNRKNSGRFDQMQDNMLNDILIKQSHQFELLTSKLEGFGYEIKTIDGNVSPDNCVKKATIIIGGN